MNPKIVSLGIVLLVVGLALPYAGYALPSPLDTVQNATFFTISKTVTVTGSNHYVSSWYGASVDPSPTGLQDPISVPNASPLWSDIQNGLATYYRATSWGANALPSSYVLDSQDSHYYYAHVGTLTNPTASIPIIAYTPTPKPTSYPIPSLPPNNHQTANPFNYFTIVGAIIAVVGLVLNKKKKE